MNKDYRKYQKVLVCNDITLVRYSIYHKMWLLIFGFDIAPNSWAIWPNSPFFLRSFVTDHVNRSQLFYSGLLWPYIFYIGILKVYFLRSSTCDTIGLLQWIGLNDLFKSIKSIILKVKLISVKKNPDYLHAVQS